jgi:hypothetical protein
VNEELVLLYFKVGNIVSTKVAAGAWGENTVGELADYIMQKLPGLSGFNRRGIYRMMQFFEAYSPCSECYSLWLNIKNQNVSPAATQIENTENQHHKFVLEVLTQISWTNHL